MDPASSESSPRLLGRHVAILGAAVAMGCGAYLLAAALTLRLGFPLDDSWIHETYARNLALTGQWAFQLDHPSAGSTSPLWTILLVPGFWIHLAPLWWSYLLGALELFGLAVVAERVARSLLSTYRPHVPWIGLFMAVEWHMLWAAVSGMETMLQAVIATFILTLVMTGSRRYVGLGLLTGLSTWVRPDGLTLAAPAIAGIVVLAITPREKGKALLLYLIGAGALILPYLALNLSLSGNPLPNTFYAKQAEYAAWQSRPFVYRLSELLLQLLTGPAVLLVPGFIAWSARSIRQRDWRTLSVLTWAVGYILLYTLRLPPYQHGRYLMPAIPILLILGLFGYLHLQSRPWAGRLGTAMQQIWQISLACLLLGFVALGARAYGTDVGLIESEMVETARWAAINLPPRAVVAAHDIGALGYFDHHRLIDLAGLVSPEVIPFLRDEQRLAGFLDEQRTDYLIAFPSFYPVLTRNLPPVHVSGGTFAPAMGEQNMTIYCWSCR